MPFVKLDTGILHSTLWIDRNGREVFITALLMAEPHYTEEPIPQLAVRTLEETGWVVPPGKYGYVPAAGVGIIRQAGVEQEAGLSALERLGAPEPDSRSQDYGGRRLVRIDGGYLVLNYFKYRDHDYGAAARMRRYRSRQGAAPGEGGGEKPTVTRNGNAVTPLHRNDVTPVTRKAVTVTEAEAEAEEEEEATVGTLDLDPTVVGARKGSRRATKRSNGKQQIKSRFVPLGFEPDLAKLQALAPPDMDLEAELAKWRDHEYRDGKTDWARAAANWIRRAATLGDYPRRRDPNKLNPRDWI